MILLTVNRHHNLFIVTFPVSHVAQQVLGGLTFEKVVNLCTVPGRSKITCVII